MIDHLLVPSFPAEFRNEFLVPPQLDSMRLLALELFQLGTGVFRTGAAEFDSLFRRALEHFAVFSAEKTSLVRPATVAQQVFHGALPLFGQGFEPFRIFMRSDIQRTGGAKQSADGDEALIRHGESFPFPQG
jgi:hypothetical protein